MPKITDSDKIVVEGESALIRPEHSDSDGTKNKILLPFKSLIFPNEGN